MRNFSPFIIIGIIVFTAPASAADPPPISCVSVALEHVSDTEPQSLDRGKIVLPSGWEPWSLGSGPDASFLVACTEAAPDRRVYVSGNVVDDGAVRFQPGLTVSQAVASAGGSNAYARLGRTSVRRDGEVLPVNLRRVILGRDPDLPLEAGDQVHVP